MAAMSISEPYAKELGRQVDELEAENARLRAALTEIRNHSIGEFGCYKSYSDIVKIATEALEQ